MNLLDSLESRQQVGIHKCHVCCTGLMTALTVLPLGISRHAAEEDTNAEDDWALATAHETGAILIWDPHSAGCVVPVVRLRPCKGPCRCACVR